MTQNNKDLHEVEDPDVKNYEPKPEGEKQFWKRHLINKHKDRNGNNDDVFNASNIGKDKSRLPGDPKADLDNPSVGTRPVDQLKGEKGIKEDKMTSADKTKREEIVMAMKKKAAGFKERYGDNYKNVMYATATKNAMEEVELEEGPSSKEIKMAAGIANDKRYAGGNMTGATNTIEKMRKGLSSHPKVSDALRRANEETVVEDSQAATSDNPGGVQGTTGTIDNNNSHLNNNPVGDPPGKGDVKNTLEAIAMQAAELHDKLEDGQEIDSQAQAMLSEAKDALDQVYEIVTNGGGAQDAKPTPAPKNGGTSANVKEAAKWRNSSAVGSISSPEYNYDNMDTIHPKSTGVKKATSDTPTAYSSLMSRPKPQFAKTGDRKGMVTKQHIDRLKSRIKAGQMEDFNDLAEEGEMYMARNQLMTAQRAIASLLPMMKGDGDMEAWVQSKLTQGAEMLDTVADYMKSKAGIKEDFENVDDSEELFEELEVLDEATVKDKTGTLVGTHKPGEGFKPNALGKKLGHAAHATDVPSDTTITKRGRKVGSKSFGASKRKGESSDEAGAQSEKPSFTDQLLKAADNREGGHVEFDNGQKHHVPRAHANAGLYHLGKPEKPTDKNKVRKHIGASKENFDSFRKSGGQLPKEAPKYDPDARIKARTAQIVGGVKKPRSAATVALAQKILARRKAGK